MAVINLGGAGGGIVPKSMVVQSKMEGEKRLEKRQGVRVDINGWKRGKGY